MSLIKLDIALEELNPLRDELMEFIDDWLMKRGLEVNADESSINIAANMTDTPTYLYSLKIGCYIQRRDLQ